MATEIEEIEDEMDEESPCLSCAKLREEFESSKREHALTIKIIKEKIISTDELIRKYQQKCQDFDKLTKQCEDLSKSRDESQRNVTSLQAQLEKSLQATEPLRKNVSMLDREKRLAESHWKTLQERLDKSQSLCDHLQIVLKKKETDECAWRLEQQVQAQELQKKDKLLKKNGDSLLKLQNQIVKEKELKKEQARELGASKRRVSKLERQLHQLQDEHSKCRYKNKIQTARSSEFTDAQTDYLSTPTSYTRRRSQRSKASTKDGEVPLNPREGPCKSLIPDDLLTFLHPPVSPLPESPAKPDEPGSTSSSSGHRNSVSDINSDVEEESGCSGSSLGDLCDFLGYSNEPLDLGLEHASGVEGVLTRKDKCDLEHRGSLKYEGESMINQDELQPVNDESSPRDREKSSQRSLTRDEETKEPSRRLEVRRIKEPEFDVRDKSPSNDKVGSFSNDDNVKVALSKPIEVHRDNYSKGCTGNKTRDGSFEERLDSTDRELPLEVAHRSETRTNTDSHISQPSSTDPVLKPVMQKREMQVCGKPDLQPIFGKETKLCSEEAHEATLLACSGTGRLKESIHQSENMNVLQREEPNHTLKVPTLCVTAAEECGIPNTTLEKQNIGESVACCERKDEISAARNILGNSCLSPLTEGKETRKRKSPADATEAPVRITRSKSRLLAKPGNPEELPAAGNRDKKRTAKYSSLETRTPASEKRIVSSDFNSSILTTVAQKSVFSESQSPQHLQQSEAKSANGLVSKDIGSCVARVEHQASEIASDKKRPDETSDPLSSGAIFSGHNISKEPEIADLDQSKRVIVQKQITEENKSSVEDFDDKRSDFERHLSRNETANSDSIDNNKKAVSTEMESQSALLDGSHSNYNNLNKALDRTPKHLSTRKSSCLDKSIVQESTDSFKTQEVSDSSVEPVKRMATGNLIAAQVSSNVSPEKTKFLPAEMSLFPPLSPPLSPLSPSASFVSDSPVSIRRSSKSSLLGDLELLDDLGPPLSPIPPSPPHDLVEPLTPSLMSDNGYLGYGEDQTLFSFQPTKIDLGHRSDKNFQNISDGVVHVNQGNGEDKLIDLRKQRPSKTPQANDNTTPRQKAKTEGIDCKSRLKGISIKPMFLSEERYVRKCLRRIDEDNIEHNLVTKRFCDKKCVSSSTPLATAVVRYLKKGTSDLTQEIVIQCRMWKKKHRGEANETEMQFIKYWTPVLTAFESNLLEVLVNTSITDHHRGLFGEVIDLLTRSIAGACTGCKDDCRGVESHCRFLTALCRKQREAKRLEILCYDILRGLHHTPAVAVRLVLNIAAVWPGIFGHDDVTSGASRCGDVTTDGLNADVVGRVDSHFSPLRCTLRAVLTKWSGDLPLGDEKTLLEYTWHKNRLQRPGDLKELALKLVYLLHRGPFTKLPVGSDGFSTLESGAFETVKSLELLACVLGWEWSHNVLIGELLWDLLQRWACADDSEGRIDVQPEADIKDSAGSLAASVERQLQDNSLNASPRLSEACIVAAIQLIGLVCRAAIEHAENPATDIVTRLCGILDLTNLQPLVTHPIQVATAFSLLQVSPWQPAQVCSCVERWLDGNSVPVPPRLSQAIACLRKMAGLSPATPFDILKSA